ncbi:hypothetical protein LSAT2_030808 [Lamellibrachia satsuma]|nr:hypothetical protein LSAT2_030808 [Lamellibrachia satsuma]
MPGGQSGDSLSKTMATKLSRKGARLEQCYEQLEQIRHVTKRELLEQEGLTSSVAVKVKGRRVVVLVRHRRLFPRVVVQLLSYSRKQQRRQLDRGNSSCQRPRVRQQFIYLDDDFCIVCKATQKHVSIIRARRFSVRNGGKQLRR